MDENLVIRNACFSDIEAIMDVEYSSFGLDICESKEVFLNRVRIFSNGFKVLLLNNKVIGYISSEIWDYSVNLDLNRFNLGHSITEVHNPLGTELYISSMGLLAQYRARGLGKYLFEVFLEEVIIEFPNIKSIVLIVSENWKKARRIYERNQFVEIDIINQFFKYSKNLYENGIIMQKKLKNPDLFDCNI